MTLLVGALATLFLSGLVWSVSSREQRAVEITALRTRELEEARRTAESATQVKA